MTEVAAPEGYTLLTDPIYEGTLPVSVALKSASDDYEEVFEETAYFYTLPITVKDGHIFVLPQTGGSGTAMFYLLGGLAVLTAAGSAVVLLRKKQPKHHNLITGKP